MQRLRASIAWYQRLNPAEAERIGSYAAAINRDDFKSLSLPSRFSEKDEIRRDRYQFASRGAMVRSRRWNHFFGTSSGMLAALCMYGTIAAGTRAEFAICAIIGLSSIVTVHECDKKIKKLKVVDRLWDQERYAKDLYLYKRIVDDNNGERELPDERWRLVNPEDL